MRRYYEVQVVQRALDVINALAGTRELSLMDLTGQLGLARSTVHRLLLMLERNGYVQRSDSRYSLGLELLRLGGIVLERADVRREALPVMRKLADLTGELVYLGVLANYKRVCIDKVEGPAPIRRYIQVGENLPAHAGASGKALLAYLSDSDLDDFIGRAGLERCCVNTITDREALVVDLGRIRVRGYAVSHEERLPGVSSVAAPIRELGGHVVASLTLSGPCERFGQDRLGFLTDEVVRSSREISERMGYGRVTT